MMQKRCVIFSSFNVARSEIVKCESGVLRNMETLGGDCVSGKTIGKGERGKGGEEEVG